MTLAGKVAVVTGGTGGLGTAIIKALSEAGAAVDVPHRHAGELEKVREECQLGPDAVLMGGLVDLTDPGAVEDYYNEVAARQGGIDILVNAVGGFGGGTPVHETDWSVWEKQLNINLKTVVLSSRYAVPHMLERSGGAIVHVGSRAGLQAAPMLSAYAASKRALLQLTESMAAELLLHDVTVNTVLPSTIDTPTNRKAVPDADHSTWVKPAEIAEVILFLVGPHARVISGAHIPVYGKA